SIPRRPRASASPRTCVCTPPGTLQEYGHTRATLRGAIDPCTRQRDLVGSPAWCWGRSCPAGGKAAQSYSTCSRSWGEDEAMKHVFESHDLSTAECGQLVDITDDVVGAVERSDVKNGMALVYSPHTTCAIVINERERGFFEDFNDFLEQIVPKEGPYYR